MSSARTSNSQKLLLRSLWAKLNFLTQHVEHYVGQKSSYIWVYQVVPIQFHDFRYNTDISIEYWPILLLITALIILLLHILYHVMLENTRSSYISQTEKTDLVIMKKWVCILLKSHTSFFADIGPISNISIRLGCSYCTPPLTCLIMN